MYRRNEQITREREGERFGGEKTDEKKMKGNEKERQLQMKSRLQSADFHNVLLDNTFLVYSSYELVFGLVFRFKRFPC